MTYIWYVDLFFLMEFFRNLFVLGLTAAFGRRKIRWIRAGAAAMIGSAFSILTVVFPVLSAGVFRLLLALAAGCVMIAAGFPLKSRKEAGKLLGFLMMAAMITGGGLFFFRQFFLLSGMESMFCLGMIGLGWGAFYKAVEKNRTAGRSRYPVRLYYRGKQKEFLALADSGNRLREPVTGKPVSVISYGDCKDFCDRISSVFCIPYCSVGKKDGLLTGIVFEKMEILQEEETLTIKKPIVAVTREPLSADGSFTMLLPEEFVS